ncbi:MAG: NAD(P)H-dependent oxidoreductase subunit E, partial [Thermoanaerobaculia bacterium]
MLPKKARREEIFEQLESAGGLRPGSVDRVHRETGVPAADVYGVATFYSLLAEPDAGVRVCQGLSCQLAGADRLMAELETAGTTATPYSCLGRCDMAPASWDPDGDATTAKPAFSPSHPDFAIDLLAAETDSYSALRLLHDKG